MFVVSWHKLLSLEGLQGLLCELQLLLQIVARCLHDRDTFRQLGAANRSGSLYCAWSVCAALSSPLISMFCWEACGSTRDRSRGTSGTMSGYSSLLLGGNQLFSQGRYAGLLCQDLS